MSAEDAYRQKAFGKNMAPETHQRAEVILAVHVLLWRSTEIFLLRRANTGFMDGHYGVPAGHVEPGERALQAAVRELREECGVDAHEQDLAFAGVLHRHAKGEPRARIDLFYHCAT
jgi:8-oxo-dGTP diphosphatase